MRFAHIIGVLLLGLMYEAEAAKILFIPLDHHSHVNYFALVGGILQDAGHDVHLLSFPRHQRTVDRSGLTPVIFPSKVFNLMADEEAYADMVLTSGQNPLYLFRNVSVSLAAVCDEMFSDAGFQRRIAAEGYDLAVVDGIDFFRCMYILPYRHGVPYVTLTSRHDPWSARLSASPSSENLTPLLAFSDPYNPTFLERATNFLAYIGSYAMMPPASQSDAMIARHAPERPATTLFDLFQDSEMFLVNVEVFCLDFPRISAPHYLFLGGVGLKPARPLPADFEEFVTGAEHGVVVMTFGSGLKRVPLERLEVMLAAYAQVPQRVIMRYDGPAPAAVPANVKLAKWLPQSDLLGHPATRLFITHGGNNGQMEALYHGVPMVTVPVFGDQFYNGQRVASRGFGKVVDYRSMTTEGLLAAMQEVLADASYKQNIADCSEKFHAMPSTADAVRYWIDHILKYGGGHLKPKYMKQPMWKLFGLDILFILGECLHFGIHGVKFLVVTIVFFVIRKLKGVLGSSKPKTE